MISGVRRREKHALMEHMEQYYNMSVQIAEELEPDMQQWFNNTMQNMELHNEIIMILNDWFNIIQKTNIQFERKPTLQNFVWYVLSTSESYEGSNVREQRKKYMVLRRDRKKYLFNIVKDEYTGKGKAKNPMYLHNNAEMYFALMRMNPDMKHYDTMEEYMEKRFQEVEEWFRNADADICSFLFFDSISPKRQAKSLEYDIGYRTYDIIINEYYSNPIDGYLFKSPKETIGTPMFSMVSSSAPVAYGLEKDVFSIYSDYIAHNGDVTTKIRTVVDSKTGDYSSIIAKGGEEEFLRQQKLNNELVTEAKVLDAMDQHLLNIIYSAFNVMDINKGRKVLSLSSLVASSFSQNRQKSYVSLLNHLDKLANYRINYSQYDETGALRRTGTFSFFDIIYNIPSKKEETSEQRYTTITISDQAGNQSLIKELDGSDLSKITIEVLPSTFLKDAWKENMNVTILTKLYDKIAPVKAKSMLIYLQNIRTDIYPQITTVLSLTALAEQFHMGSMRKKQMIAAIEESLNILKKEKIVVKDYIMSTQTLTLEFYPFTEQEKYFYKLSETEDALPQMM